MKFLIITHVPHKVLKDNFFAYSPYVREMNLWLRHVNEVEVIAPFSQDKISSIDLAYNRDNLSLNIIPSIEFTSIKKGLISLIKIPKILYAIYNSCKAVDHIHLRCPGNIGLLGCLVQIAFPKKIKTAKYAGNWDPSAKQPLSYKFQKWILSNVCLIRNIQVLVYGVWGKQTKNIKPFFTATYSDLEKEASQVRDYSNRLKFLFVGSLVKGKRPLLAIQIIEAMHELGKKVSLDIYGDGILRGELEKYVLDNKLDALVVFHGNQEKNIIRKAFKTAHFLILQSKSEGWPKAIAEAMFFGTIPISNSVSCVPYMLDYGKRGVLVEPELNKIIRELEKHLESPELLKKMSKLASVWSQNYTLEVFEKQIKRLLQKD